MQHHAAEQLDVEVTHGEHAPGGFAADRERLGKQVFQGLTVRQALAEFFGLAGKLLVGQRRYRGLEGVDRLDGLAIASQEPLVATAEDLGQETLDHWEFRRPRYRGTG